MSLAYESFKANSSDIDALMRIHSEQGGTKRGRRFDLSVLNRSAVVLITACWEAYVEDICTEAYEFLLKKSTSHKQIPVKIRAAASAVLKKDEDHRRLWQLAGDGWKQVLSDYRHEVIGKRISGFNTPRTDNVQALFRELLAIDDITSTWHWKNMSRDKARSRLDDYVTDRCAIAHRTDIPEGTITKPYVIAYLGFINNIVLRVDNSVNDMLQESVGSSLLKWFLPDRRR